MERRARGGDRAVLAAIRGQARACRDLGSPLYAGLLDSLAADHEAGGVTRRLLDGRSGRPVHDAVVLRLLAAAHRLALEGRAPAYAAHLPSCGGRADGDPAPAFLALVEDRAAEMATALERPVQTNEVARAGALLGGFHEVARRTPLPLRLREVGASAGLLLGWDRYRYETGAGSFGPERSPLVLRGLWRRPPRLADGVVVVDRRGCDVAPLDPTDEGDRRTLESFVWPDQAHRRARLQAALEVARRHPVTVDRADAGQWLAADLADPRPGAVTVVHHSIVLQYLPRRSFELLRDALARAGAAATDDAPLAWLRMEPAGPRADVRLTWWPGGHDTTLGTSGYHGDDVDWACTADGPRRQAALRRKATE